MVSNQIYVSCSATFCSFSLPIETMEYDDVLSRAFEHVRSLDVGEPSSLKPQGLRTPQDCPPVHRERPTILRCSNQLYRFRQQGKWYLYFFLCFMYFDRFSIVPTTHLVRSTLPEPNSLNRMPTTLAGTLHIPPPTLHWCREIEEILARAMTSLGSPRRYSSRSSLAFFCVKRLVK